MASSVPEEFACCNWLLCNDTAPHWLLQAQNGCCTKCFQLYGSKLKVAKLACCPVCQEVGVFGVRVPDCNHFVCITCFKETVYIFGGPIFMRSPLLSLDVPAGHENMDLLASVCQWHRTNEQVLKEWLASVSSNRRINGLKCPVCKKGIRFKKL